MTKKLVGSLTGKNRSRSQRIGLEKRRLGQAAEFQEGMNCERRGGRVVGAWGLGECHNLGSKYMVSVHIN